MKRLHHFSFLLVLFAACNEPPLISTSTVVSIRTSGDWQALGGAQLTTPTPARFELRQTGRSELPVAITVERGDCAIAGDALIPALGEVGLTARCRGENATLRITAADQTGSLIVEVPAVDAGQPTTTPVDAGPPPKTRCTTQLTPMINLDFGLMDVGTQRTINVAPLFIESGIDCRIRVVLGGSSAFRLDPPDAGDFISNGVFFPPFGVTFTPIAGELRSQGVMKISVDDQPIREVEMRGGALPFCPQFGAPQCPSAEPGVIYVSSGDALFAQRGADATPVMVGSFIGANFGGVGDLCVAADGTLFGTGAQLLVIDPTTAVVRGVVPLPGGSANGLVCLPDGRLIIGRGAFVGAGGLWRFELDSGVETLLMPAPSISGDVLWHSDSEVYVTTNVGPTDWLAHVDFTTRTVRLLFDLRTPEVYGLAEDDAGLIGYTAHGNVLRITLDGATSVINTFPQYWTGAASAL